MTFKDFLESSENRAKLEKCKTTGEVYGLLTAQCVELSTDEKLRLDEILKIGMLTDEQLDGINGGAIAFGGTLCKPSEETK